jgi:hypothetical protein
MATVPRVELQQFLKDRSAYFGNKAKVAEEQLKRVKAVVQEAEAATADADDENPAHSNKSGYSNRTDPEADLRAKAKEFQGRQPEEKALSLLWTEDMRALVCSVDCCTLGGSWYAKDDKSTFNTFCSNKNYGEERTKGCIVCGA